MSDTYEIHVHKGGRWQIDNVSNNKEQALASARDLTTSKHIQAVKVIEEKVIDDEGDTRTRTIFNQSKVADKPKGKGKGKEEEENTLAAKPETGKPGKKKKKNSALSTVIVALIGMAILLIALIGLAAFLE